MVGKTVPEKPFFIHRIFITGRTKNCIQFLLTICTDVYGADIMVSCVGFRKEKMMY